MRWRALCGVVDVDGGGRAESHTSAEEFAVGTQVMARWLPQVSSTAHAIDGQLDKCDWYKAEVVGYGDGGTYTLRYIQDGMEMDTPMEAHGIAIIKHIAPPRPRKRKASASASAVQPRVVQPRHTQNSSGRQRKPNSRFDINIYTR